MGAVSGGTAPEQPLIAAYGGSSEEVQVAGQDGRSIAKLRVGKQTLDALFPHRLRSSLRSPWPRVSSSLRTRGALRRS
jgi:hypothetical protein